MCVCTCGSVTVCVSFFFFCRATACNSVEFYWAARHRNSFRLQLQFRRGPRQRFLQADAEMAHISTPLSELLSGLSLAGGLAASPFPPGKTDSNQSLAPKRLPHGSLCRLPLAYSGGCACLCALIKMQKGCLACNVCGLSLSLIPGQTIVFDHILFTFVALIIRKLYTHARMPAHTQTDRA